MNDARRRRTAKGRAPSAQQIDRAIDEVVRQMVVVSAPADLRRRVLARISSADTPAGAVMMRPAWSWAAAMAVVAIVIGVLLFQSNRSVKLLPTAEVARLGTEPKPAPTRATDAPAIAPHAAPGEAEAPARHRDARVAARAAAAASTAPPTSTTEPESTVAMMDPLPAPTALAIEPLTAETIELEYLSIAALDVEPLQLDPLPQPPR